MGCCCCRSVGIDSAREISKALKDSAKELSSNLKGITESLEKFERFLVTVVGPWADGFLGGGFFLLIVATILFFTVIFICVGGFFMWLMGPSQAPVLKVAAPTFISAAPYALLPPAWDAVGVPPQLQFEGGAQEAIALFGMNRNADDSRLSLSHAMNAYKEQQDFANAQMIALQESMTEQLAVNSAFWQRTMSLCFVMVVALLLLGVGILPVSTTQGLRQGMRFFKSLRSS
eukprot:gb/GFBE01067173.1/.p1 GENE.gb/GFBE01067173.1/~~gb/GFBE01067173.1/.p1  ORF type:complete len:231 (+),score=50.00 gb/GFBE01067173.1/:1-693(+)